ncbi:unnamed protein product [Rotaria sp. Silwood2]|nr:unnamed protein product [Rotaria sp. Silwood2]CAF3335908.1 unnamed protein product [Rotaria sp. Silwood2]CAF4186358.1 unnamed protein product [Rotaria sp. Silwood2]CAF4254385.1 unnamed protein product [Rotaria sp. Silwood2]CAF4473649.1 unnamed protein product [Rotaria sp. Silwood2]
MSKEHRNGVYDLLTNSFFRDEPLFNYVQLDIPNEPSEVANPTIEKALQDKCSYIAIDRSQQKLVGVSLNVIENVNDQIKAFDVSQFKSEKVRYVFELVNSAHGHIDLYKTFKTDRLLHMLFLSIDDKYRGFNLGKQLMDLSMELAKSYGIKGAYTEATSIYSAKEVIKMGFQEYNKIIYAEYDKKRLTNLGVHDHCLFLAKSL